MDDADKRTLSFPRRRDGDRLFEIPAEILSGDLPRFFFDEVFHHRSPLAAKVDFFGQLLFFAYPDSSANAGDKARASVDFDFDRVFAVMDDGVRNIENLVARKFGMDVRPVESAALLSVHRYDGFVVDRRRRESQNAFRSVRFPGEGEFRTIDGFAFEVFQIGELELPCRVARLAPFAFLRSGGKFPFVQFDRVVFCDFRVRDGVDRRAFPVFRLFAPPRFQRLGDAQSFFGREDARLERAEFRVFDFHETVFVSPFDVLQSERVEYAYGFRIRFHFDRSLDGERILLFWIERRVETHEPVFKSVH